MPRTLHAGPLTLRYENGDIRALKLGKIEVIRRIYAAVRDRDWGTVPIEISDEQIVDGGDHFHISFRASHRQGDIDFEWTGVITGAVDGTINFSFEGETKSDFWRTRIGFSVLHPIRECVDAPVLIEHIDGSTDASVFPVQIAPHCPFQNIKAMTHCVASDLWAKLTFDGDTFETEDQRNWADASYKTYCTPLALPYPVRVEAGTKISQRITFSFEGDLSAAETNNTDNQPLRMSVSEHPISEMPPLGLGIAQDNATLTPSEIERLKQLKLSHLRVDLWLSDASWPQLLQRANSEARALVCQLEIAVFTGDNPDFVPLTSQLKELKPAIKSMLLFRDNTMPVTPEILQKASVIFPSIPIGTGSNAYFTEFNRQPPPVADFVVFSANPQIHAFDDVSIMETPEALVHIVQSARAKLLSNGVALSPLTLKPRFNAVATGEAGELLPDELPANVDIRQTQTITAAWTLGAISELVDSGFGSKEFDSLTLFETTGWRGVMESEVVRRGKNFPSHPGQLFPIWYVLEALASFRGQDVYTLNFGQDRRVTGLACRGDKSWKILLVNQSDQTLKIEFPTKASLFQMRNLEPHGWTQFREIISAHFEIGSYAIIALRS